MRMLFNKKEKFKKEVKHILLLLTNNIINEARFANFAKILRFL